MQVMLSFFATGVKKQVPLTHSRTALQDTGCAVSTGALNILLWLFYILHVTKMGLMSRKMNPDSSWHHWNGTNARRSWCRGGVL